MRQSLLAVFALLLVVAVAAFEDIYGQDAVPKVRIAGTVTQLTSLERSAREKSVRFRLSSFAFELDIATAALAPLTRQGLAQPFNVGSQVAAIVAKSELAARERSPEGSDAIPVLALIVEGQPVLGTSAALRVAPAMRVWPYLLLVCVAGVIFVFGHKRRRRRARRT